MDKLRLLERELQEAQIEQKILRKMQKVKNA